ncbi:uncharacterized protein [Haliotis cracherodii]|uniref:uncharacterized protein n=1 Tax=Haliotis cracherodii TaxID=6455 RepID=UPI0039EBB227
MIKIGSLSWLLFSTYLIPLCTSHESIVPVIQRLDEFDRKLHETQVDMNTIEGNVLNIIDVAKLSLRAELKEIMRDQVREAMAEILQGESLQDMVKSQVVSELRHLKQGYHQMKRQLHHVSRSFKDFQDEMVVFHESIVKKADVWKHENSSDVFVRDIHRLEKELHKCDVYAAELKADNARFLELNETYQFQISQLKTALALPASSQATQLDIFPSKPPVSTTSVTTPRPEEEKSRILIAPLISLTEHQFRQLNIHSNSLSVYQYHTMKKVSCFAYIAKTRKLVIGSYHPDKIVSSTLDTGHVKLLREGVRTIGMAVDEERDIVFMTTEAPRYLISRMSTQGKNFTAIIDLSKYGSWPSGITLDNKRKKIYGCNNEKLFTVTYDGQGLATLATGSNMHAVTLDQTAGVLYYNNQKKLMKMTVSNNVSTEVATLTTIPWNMMLYRGTIYYSSYSPGNVDSGSVGAVDLTFNSVQYLLKSISMTKIRGLHIQLIP